MHNPIDYESSDGLSRHAHLGESSQSRPVPVKAILEEERAFELLEEERVLACNMVPDGAIEKAEQVWDETQTQRVRAQ